MVIGTQTFKKKGKKTQIEARENFTDLNKLDDKVETPQPIRPSLSKLNPLPRPRQTPTKSKPKNKTENLINQMDKNDDSIISGKENIE